MALYHAQTRCHVINGTQPLIVRILTKYDIFHLKYFQKMIVLVISNYYFNP